MRIQINTMPGTIALVLFMILVLPSRVFAHLVNTEVGEFYAGMMHPMTSLDHVLPMGALAILLSQMGNKAVRVAMAAFPLCLTVGMFLGKSLMPSDMVHLFSLLILVISGVCLVFINRVLDKTSGFGLAILLTCATALILGYRSGVDMAFARVSLQFIPGVALTGFIVIALAAAWIPRSPGGIWDHLRTMAGGVFCCAGLFMTYQFLSGDIIPNGIGFPTEDSLKAMIAQKNLTAAFMTTTLIASILWGAGHALTPGHGKAIVGAYLVGAHASAWHAIYLGLTVTITHTLGVFLLGAVAMFASRYILPADLYPYLGALSGLIVFMLGAGMVWKRTRFYHGHHHHHHDHDHNDDNGHTHHGHSHSGHSHLPPGADGSPVTWKALLGLGISGGLLPCPSALVLLLTAISINRLEFGMLLVVFFSLGLAGVLTTVGLLFVKGSRIFKTTGRFERVAHHIPVASAFIILVIGTVITIGSIKPLIIG